MASTWDAGLAGEQGTFREAPRLADPLAIKARLELAEQLSVLGNGSSNSRPWSTQPGSTAAETLMSGGAGSNSTCRGGGPRRRPRPTPELCCATPLLRSFCTCLGTKYIVKYTIFPTKIYPLTTLEVRVRSFRFSVIINPLPNEERPFSTVRAENSSYVDSCHRQLSPKHISKFSLGELAGEYVLCTP